MKTLQRDKSTFLSPLMFLLALVALLALACSNSTPKAKSTIALKETNTPSQKQSSNPQTPRPTQRIYSPLVASGGTARPTASGSISVNPAIIETGVTLTVTVGVQNIDEPTYHLYLRDSGAEDGSEIAEITAEDMLLPGTTSSHVFELVSAHGGPAGALFFLRGVEIGSVDVWMSVTSNGASANTSPIWVSEIVPVQVNK